MRKIYIALLLMIAFAACRQKDIQVAPVGQSLPYGGANKTMVQLLDSTNLTIFKAAWNKINMDSVLSTTPLTGFTLLAPTDDAFKAAGITMDSINAMSVADLDTIVFLHTLSTWVKPDQLKGNAGNIQFNSFLVRTDFGNYYSFSPYVYLQCMGYQNGKLMINGTAHPLNSIDATNGTLYLLDQVQQKPDSDMIDYLQNNPDFSLFMLAMHINDSLYDANYLYGAYFDDFLTATSTCRQYTLFAPTNHAFNAAGYYTYDDLLARANRSYIDYANYNQDNFYVTPVSALDSQLMSLHLDLYDAYPPSTTYVYYTNDLTDNPQLSNLLIDPGGMYRNPPLRIRLRFTTSGDQILVSEIGSSLPAVPLVKTNLRFRNGVIHVIDAGLIAP